MSDDHQYGKSGPLPDWKGRQQRIAWSFCTLQSRGEALEKSEPDSSATS